MNNQKMEDTEVINKNIAFDEIHWWQFPLGEFSVKLNKDFKDMIFSKIQSERIKSLEFASYINNQSKKYNKNWNFKRQRALIWEYKVNAEFIPAWFIYECALYFNLDMLEIEGNIASYITFRGRVVIDPKFPIMVTPEFTSIPIHIMGDGCLKPGGMFCYGQKDISGLQRFVSLIKHVFGDYNLADSKRKYGIPVVYIPKILSKIVTNHFGIKTYLSSECTIPKRIKHLDKFHRIAVLSAFLHDEGCTSMGVYICSSNINLLKDIIGIGETLGYGFNSIQTSYPKYYNKRKVEHYRVTMSASSIEKFYLDLTSLYDRFPLLNIGQKYKNLEKWTAIRNKGWAQRKKTETKSIIIGLLRNGGKTAFQLGEEANISVWTTYHHLQQLAKKGQVIKYKQGRRFLYLLA